MKKFILSLIFINLLFLPIGYISISYADDHDTTIDGDDDTTLDGGDDDTTIDGADDDTTIDGVKLWDPLGGVDSLDQLFVKLLDKLLYVVALLVLPLAIVYSGFLFISAQGNPEKIKKARATLQWTLIGAVVILGSKLIATVISETLRNLGS